MTGSVPCALPPALNPPDTIISHHYTSQDPTHFLLLPPQLQPTMSLARSQWLTSLCCPQPCHDLCACATPSRQIPSSQMCPHPCSRSSLVLSHLPLIASCPQPSVARSASERHLCPIPQAHLLGSTWMQNCLLLPRMLAPIPGAPQSGAAAAHTAPTFPRPIHFSVPFCLAPTSASPLPNLLSLRAALPNPGCVSSLLLKGCSAVPRPFARNSVP